MDRHCLKRCLSIKEPDSAALRRCQILRWRPLGALKGKLKIGQGRKQRSPIPKTKNPVQEEY